MAIDHDPSSNSDFIRDLEREERERLIASLTEKHGEEISANILSSMTQLTNATLKLAADSSTNDPNRFADTLRDISNQMEKRVTGTGQGIARLSLTIMLALLEEQADQSRKSSVVAAINILESNYHID